MLNNNNDNLSFYVYKAAWQIHGFLQQQANFHLLAKGIQKRKPCEDPPMGQS